MTPDNIISSDKPPRESFAALLPGMIVCVILSVSALFLSRLVPVPVMMLALIGGLGLARAGTVKALKPGIEFTAKPLLLVAVALLGLKVDIGAILSAEGHLPFLSLGALVLTFLFGLLVCKALGIGREFGILISGAVAICGISAAAALCCALPACQKRHRELTVTIAGITILSAAAMVAYPIAAHVLGLDDVQSGAFFGATIHNVSQVVGAGYSVSVESGDVATFVKLIRVSAMLPVIMMVSFFYGRGGEGTARNKWTVYFPPFLIVFFALALMNSLGAIPTKIIPPLFSVSEFLLIMSLAAIGLKTRLFDIAMVGPKPLMAMTWITVFMAGITLCAVMVF